MQLPASARLPGIRRFPEDVTVANNPAPREGARVEMPPL